MLYRWRLLKARKCRVGRRRHGLVVIVDFLEVNQWDRADSSMEYVETEPIDAIHRPDLQIVPVLPGTAIADQLDLGQ